MSLRHTAIRLALTSLAVAAIPTASRAQVTQYSDQSAFLTALGGTPTIENFLAGSELFLGSTLNSASSYPTFVNPGDIQAGVTYSVASGSLTIDEGGGFTGGFLDGPTYPDWSAVGPLTATFDSPTHGFGFLTNGTAGDNVTVDIYRGATKTSYTFTGIQSLPGDLFIGFVSDATDITSAVIGGDSDLYTFAVDDFTFLPAASTTSTPEPATFGLLATGLVGIAGIARRRKSR
ncbi:MAG: PEP-CTERM sorting domain-containing protein [Gemmatimonadaceae bacterium]